MYRMDRNDGRADMFVSSFIDGVDWKDEVASLESHEQSDKATDSSNFANKYFGEQSNALIYKRTR